MPTLGGSTFVYNAIAQDYNIIETLNCLYDICDEVSVAMGGDDGTIELICSWIKEATLKSSKPIISQIISESEWNEQQGREKLSYFSNVAIGNLTTDYNLYVQADEVVSEQCMPFIRQAIETGKEAFMLTRINCWQSAYTMLAVAQDRKPCSTEVIRLTKTKYRCVDDAESLGVPEVSFEFTPHIRIYHVGFVRDKDKHLTKILHMQEKVFLWEVDKRIHNNTDGFDCWKWGFDHRDVMPIKEKLPKYIRQWAQERLVPPFNDSPEGKEYAKEWVKYAYPGQEYSEDLWWRWAKKYQ